jgi:hypothetical protein
MNSIGSSKISTQIKAMLIRISHLRVYISIRNQQVPSILQACSSLHHVSICHREEVRLPMAELFPAWTNVQSIEIGEGIIFEQTVDAWQGLTHCQHLARLQLYLTEQIDLSALASALAQLPHFHTLEVIATNDTDDIDALEIRPDVLNAIASSSSWVCMHVRVNSNLWPLDEFRSTQSTYLPLVPFTSLHSRIRAFRVHVYDTYENKRLVYAVGRDKILGALAWVKQ